MADKLYRLVSYEDGDLWYVVEDGAEASVGGHVGEWEQEEDDLYTLADALSYSGKLYQADVDELLKLLPQEADASIEEKKAVFQVKAEVLKDQPDEPAKGVRV